MIRSVLLLLTVLPVVAFPQTLREFARRAGVPVYDVEVLSSLPHDEQSFTQGLLYRDGILYESTGLYGRSSVRKIDAATGAVLQTVALDSSLFGEGLAFWNDELVQVTWNEGLALFYHPFDLTLIRKARYVSEGWGLAADEQGLWLSDGNPRLQRRDPQTFEFKGSLEVTLGGFPVGGLNELEYARGRLYANLLGADFILEIHPRDGKVTGVVDASPLRELAGASAYDKPLNGIAYDPASGDFFLTGKLWPEIFRVRFVRSFTQ